MAIMPSTIINCLGICMAIMPSTIIIIVDGIIAMHTLADIIYIC